jgi:hypothetical protein
MSTPFDDLQVTHGETVIADDIAVAVTRGELVYEDGSTQTFTRDGTTTYVENGRRTRGEWYVDGDGRFCSFWPPRYRATYELHWVVENERIIGLRFSDSSKGTEFNGRYS